MHGLQKWMGERPSVTSSMDGFSRSLKPDPIGHAQALIEACGPENALQIAEIYAQSYAEESYWPRVYAAVSSLVTCAHDTPPAT